MAIELGTDFNFYQVTAVATASFPTTAQAILRFRGQHQLMFICESGSVEYSFNGNTVHGKATAAGQDAKLMFGVRTGNKIWLRGTGTIRIEAWT